MDVERVVDDEVPVPHHGEVDWEVADVAALVVVLRRREGKKRREKLFMSSFIEERDPNRRVS